MKGRYKGGKCLDRVQPGHAPEPSSWVRSQLLPASRVIVYQETDWELVQRYRGGDRAAFAELMTRYQRPVYNAAFGVLHRAEDAKDITQDVFLKVVDRLNEYDPKFKFFSWIYRIALNESFNLKRRNNRCNFCKASRVPACRLRKETIPRSRWEMSNFPSGSGAL